MITNLPDELLDLEDGNVNFARRPGGLREESFFTWSYNPTIGESGEIAGLFAIASETPRQVVGDRRLGILRELSIRMALDKKVEDIFRSMEEVLSQAAYDVPFALRYLPVSMGVETETTAASGWGCGWPVTSRRPTGGASTWSPRRMEAPPSPRCCRGR
ncbi:aerobic respiration control sensor protein [Corallococcus coralloides]|uniref:Aerobic respiration control sensor protein n=1 Tax=Corallococcus coralloides TaxID=184914 RepID=A0A410RM72_CORCK|nr:hypothetical protein [Corallococcus coralloides]QAT83012.1 aerobic respiration control sensor protein [Corallococcus coralloides]